MDIFHGTSSDSIPQTLIDLSPDPVTTTFTSGTSYEETLIKNK
jgi:hypothetical protein